jgi:hypothetical protein
MLIKKKNNLIISLNDFGCSCKSWLKIQFTFLIYLYIFTCINEKCELKYEKYFYLYTTIYHVKWF